MEKKELRAQIREKKKALTQEQIRRYSEKLTEMLLEQPVYRQARAIFGYLPYNQEVLTWALLRRAMADGKRVAVPKVLGDTMAFLWLDDLSRVAPGYCGIPEPVADGPVAEDPTALVLMPGLAFDRQGGRIGYGGGFYDRFLEREPEHPTVALCYGFQLVERVPMERFDRPVDLVLAWGGVEGEE